MKNISLLILCLVFSIGSFAQKREIKNLVQPPSKISNLEKATQNIENNQLKSAGVSFWEEHFDWGDESSQIGWFLPDDWSEEDPTDIGYNWHWANDTLKGVYTNEPIMESSTAYNGVLALNLDGYNSDIANYADYIPVDNSIISPKIDCSTHSSVLVRIEQRFRYWSSAVMLFEVTNDAGVHWASFDMKMGTLINETVGGVAARQKVDLYLNISDVAAGMPEVQFKITWRDSRLYYWMIDDITFMEGWDTDLQMLYYEADYDNGLNDPEGFFYQVPYNQLSGYNFYSVIRNFGNLEQWGTNMNVKVIKNNQIIWDQSTDPFISYPLVNDTLVLDQQFVPEDFGHYKIDFTISCENEDELPEDNFASVPFNVTDSVFSRADTSREVSFTTWAWYSVDHEGDYMGTWYTLKEDVEINSITAYINHADIDYSIRFVVFALDEETGDPFELLSSDMIPMDSTILKNHWVTLPLEKDGEGEFLLAGQSYMAAVWFSSPMSYEEAYDSRRYSIGSDRTNYYPSGKCWYYFAVDDAWYSSGNDLFMIAMNFNDNSNIIDAITLQKSDLPKMGQNYPNPFANQTTISYKLEKENSLDLIIMDLTGRKVYEQNLGQQYAGEHEVLLQASDFEAGTYFYTLKGIGYKETKRMTVLKRNYR